MYLLLIDKKAPARVVKLFLRSCRIGLTHFICWCHNLGSSDWPREYHFFSAQSATDPSWLAVKSQLETDK